MSAGAFTAWLASGVQWVNQFGWFGWWIAGLLGVLLALYIAIGIAWLRNAWIKGRLMQKWGQTVEAINPLDQEFTRKRVNPEDIANPISKRLIKKRFIDCEVMGPANIIFSVANNINECNFYNCDIIVAKKNAHIINVLVFEGSSVIDCDFWNCTIYIEKIMAHTFSGIMNKDFVTLTGYPEIDNRFPPNIGA